MGHPVAMSWSTGLLLACAIASSASSLVSAGGLPKMGMNVAIGHDLVSEASKIESANNVIVDAAGFLDKAKEQLAANDIVELDYDPFINKPNGVMRPIYTFSNNEDENPYDEDVGVFLARSKRSIEGPADEQVATTSDDASQQPLVRKRRCGGGGGGDDGNTRRGVQRTVRRIVRRRLANGNDGVKTKKTRKVKKTKSKKSKSKSKKKKSSKKYKVVHDDDDDDDDDEDEEDDDDDDETHEVVVTTKKVIQNGVVVSQSSSEAPKSK